MKRTKILKTAAKIMGVAIVMSMMLSTAAFADTAKLNVTGVGTLSVTPDIAYLNVGVRTTNSDADAAAKENIQKAAAIVDALKDLGIDQKDIKTQAYYVNPAYDYSSGTNQITGYEVTNSLNVTIRNIDEIGKIIDTCIAAGSNVMNGLSYGVENSVIYYDQLYSKALNDAASKASAIAKSLGVNVTAPVYVSENGYVTAPVAYRDMGATVANTAKMMDSTYTTPGEIDLSVTLSVGYDLETRG